MNTDDIHQAIDRQIPAMRQRGFTIGTPAGQISIPPGWIADRMADHLTRALQCELLHETKDRYHQQPSVSGPDSQLNRRKADQHGL